MSALTIASHTAYLAPMSGMGLLVLPHADANVADPAPTVCLTVHEAEWNAAVRHLDGMGWEPAEDEAGGVHTIGQDSEGRCVVALHGREPITSEPTFEAMSDDLADLCREAGVLLS